MPYINGIPLFNTVAMEINAKCNRRCIFCPQHKFYKTRASNIKLPTDVIEKTLYELADIKYRGRFEPFLFNEALMDPRFLDIMDMVREILPKVTISLNTNGDYIKSADHLKEIVKRVHAVEINTYSTKRIQIMKDYVKQAKEELEFEFYDDHIYKPVPRNKRVLYEMEKIDFQNLGGVHKINNRSGYIPWLVRPTPYPIAKMCVRPFRMLMVNYNGDMILCCNAFFGKITFGNVRDHTIKELWKGDKINKYRRRLLKKNRDMPLCRECDFNGGPYQHVAAKQWIEYYKKGGK